MTPKARTLSREAVTVAQSGLPPPVISYDTDQGRWRLEETYSFDDGHHTITIPEGFEFDLSSVPRLFWRFIAPFELSIVAPLIHDFLYRHRGDLPAGAVTPPRTYTRKEADRLFKRAMKQEGVPGWRWRVAYGAVRLFGKSAWDD